MVHPDWTAHPEDVDYATHDELARFDCDRGKLWTAIQSDAVGSLQCVIDALPDPVVIKDRDHRWVAVNEAVCRLAERSREEIVGRTSFDFFPEAQARAQWAADDEVLARGGEADWNATLRAPTGRQYQVRSRNRRLTLGTPPNEAIFVLSVVEDVTQAQEAELKLRESEENYRYTLELSPQIPWTAGPDGQVLELGPQWESQVGKSLGEALAGGWIDVVHSDDRGSTVDLWERSLATGEPFDAEYRLRTTQGDYRWVRAWAAARLNPRGEVLRWYGTLEDIQDRKSAEAALEVSVQQFRDLADYSPVMIWVSDETGATTFMNELWYEKTGQSAADALGAGWLEAVHPEDRGAVSEAYNRAAAAARSFRSEYRLRHVSGRWLWVIDAGEPRFGPDGAFIGYVGTVLDITERRLAEAEAQKAAARLSTVLESTTDCVIGVDRVGRITYLNRNAETKLEDFEPALGKRLSELFPEERGGVFSQRFAEALAGQSTVSFESYLPALDEWLEVHAYPTNEGLSLFFRNITERRRADQEQLVAQEKIAHMARHDALTGLPNRLLFNEELGRLLAQAPTRTAAVLFLDLDRFKEVNDTLGHAEGDALLRLVARRLKSNIRGSDTIARLGGDEFAIVQADIRRPADAIDLAERIIKDLAEPFDLDGNLIFIGVSIGIALAPGDSGLPEQLLRSADTALYRAKNEGGGTYRLFEPEMHERLRERQAMKLALHGALGRGEFEVHYQPLINLQTGKISCFEALVRWRHPERGLIAPDEFIPVAEENDFITSIGALVLNQACKAAVGWPSEIDVAVNLSPLQFRGHALVATVTEAYVAAGLDPRRLQLEITESVILHESSANLRILTELRQLGVRIALDDFGTGYSSLSYLRHFPVDKLKLDRSFVGDLPDGVGARAIVRAVAGLAAGLGLTMTAEGIESADQVEALLEEGYTEGQGYYFSVPVSADKVLELIAANAVAANKSSIVH
jgi:diguanylate cyclase (GGDEF)-like protein/PAS domain S-box-containing protein